LMNSGLHQGRPPLKARWKVVESGFCCQSPRESMRAGSFFKPMLPIPSQSSLQPIPEGGPGAPPGGPGKRLHRCQGKAYVPWTLRQKAQGIPIAGQGFYDFRQFKNDGFVKSRKTVLSPTLTC
jgi:hypothetical protein